MGALTWNNGLAVISAPARYAGRVEGGRRIAVAVGNYVYGLMKRTNRQILPLISGLVVLALGCSGGPATEAATVDSIDWLVTFDSIGPVQVGTTIEQIEASLGPDFEITEASPRDDWLAGYAVSLDGEVLVYVGTKSLEDPRFEFLLSDSPLVALDSGLRPGMPLDEAVELHGELTFSD